MSTMSFDFPENVVTAYTEGDCWYLAKVLSEQTGWKLYWAGTKRGHKHYSWCHIFVVNNGEVIDITGVHSMDDFTKNWRKIAKSWGIIKNSSDFVVREVEDINAMTCMMRPKYSVSSDTLNYVNEIKDLVMIK